MSIFMVVLVYDSTKLNWFCLLLQVELVLIGFRNVGYLEWALRIVIPALAAVVRHRKAGLLRHVAATYIRLKSYDFLSTWKP